MSDFLVKSAEKAAETDNRITFDGPPRNSKPNWKFKIKKSRKVYHPKWHDATCESVRKKIRQSTLLLKKYPNNQYLKSQLFSESKQYKKLLKSKHKEHLAKLFIELDNMQQDNPRGYMNLVRSLRNGSFDKKISDDSSFVSPEAWHSHFSKLLGPSVTLDHRDEALRSYIDQNCDNQIDNLGHPFTRSELIEGISGLPNNKASSFDKITNEILKTAKLIITKPLLLLFNKILNCSLYPSQWKCDILSPLHKAGEKSDPNNFRGISVSSCLGKLFNKLMQRRLEKYCREKNLIHRAQGSGKAGSRTADHLLVVRFLVDKYVHQKGGKLFTCFVDLQKAFDTVPRNKLFYSLLNDYSIGGKFLKILQEIYKDNKVFVKTSDGLLQPIITTIGVKQGCVFSPILFNLFIDKICSIFYQSCSPVRIDQTELNCLLWADDLLLCSKTDIGLQNCIDKMENFYSSLGLRINIKKTKIIIFNKRGLKLDNILDFSLGDKRIEIADQYQYLGLKLKPSGSMGLAVGELFDKASRAWFGISNVLYKHKRMEVDKCFQLFDSLVTPVALYGSEFWLPHILPNNCFKNKENLSNFWEKFTCEKLNQKCSRVVLSVNRKTSRLAVLGELNRYPLFIKALSQCVNYKFSLQSQVGSNSLVSSAIVEMKAMSEQGLDCWLSRVDKIQNLLGIPNLLFRKNSGKKISATLKSKFDKHWLDCVNQTKTGSDQRDHNKLRTYKTFKGSFTREPYIDLVRNRNQRAQLSRIRVSSHTLAVERGRWTKPVTPIHERFCDYCSSSVPEPVNPTPSSASQPPPDRQVDTELHFLIQCPKFKAERNIVFSEMSKFVRSFDQFSDQEKFVTMLCPTEAQSAKLINRFIKTMFDARSKIDNNQS